ncbi:MAG: diphosphate--fructose-6-phosphate 1-phosphotransferase [Tannerella sp.]|jgi:pyrophosphate--fructose-6-phosphate 1-phosphotransferase|nr:diphosphate--fructose-6-phosphate 1-phosphotransferase [Tannerella sp.]
MTKSVLQLERAKYCPKMPSVLKQNVVAIDGKKTESVADRDEIQSLFPHTYGMPIVTFKPSDDIVDYPAINVGVILSGGQAPGGHNVIAGIFDGLKEANKSSRLFGFLLGPGGLLKGNAKELTADIIDEYRNTGGFDIIGSDRTKLKDETDFARALDVLKKLEINALVIIGGDDSNTNACVLAEYFKQIGSDIQVIGCPKTIDGDLKNEQIETSFGFDTACKVYSEVIGNIQRDCNSAKKYWHFIKLMGRSASHIALECALQTHPNLCIVSEEVKQEGSTLDGLVSQIVNLVIKRNLAKKHFGTVLIPEGLIEFIPEIDKLIKELNTTLAEKIAIDPKSIPENELIAEVCKLLSPESRELYSVRLPETVSRQLALDRDAHGNVQVSLIETEKLLADKVAVVLKTLLNSEFEYRLLTEKKGMLELKNKGIKEDRWSQEDKDEMKDIKAKMKPFEDKYRFSPQTHFFGYEGRCAAPSNYDSDYCYSLGYTASRLILTGKTGYMSSVRNTTKPADQWVSGGIPITMMMNIEYRPKATPVIQKALVKLDAAPFKEYAAHRKDWAMNDDYLYPGPIQFNGSPELTDQPTITLKLEQA